MARAPFVVLIYPCIRVGDSFEYALLRRSDPRRNFWDSVAGSGEDNETPLEAAKRETFEETGIRADSFIKLDTIAPLPVTRIKESHLWGNELYVIPLYYFGVIVDNRQIVLSHEHIEYKWLGYQAAYDLLKYDDDKIALWELDRRVRGLGPRD